MELHTLWFFLIGLLFTGYFILEGYDYGVGILLPFLGKSDNDRRLMLNAMGPFWLGNETWLVAAVGMIFAAFPKWYAALLSSLYPVFFLLLLALILRGGALEFRSHHIGKRWRSLWDWLIFGGSLLPGLCWGIIVSALLHGLPIGGNMRPVESPWYAFSSPSILQWGAVFVGLFVLQGALFLSWRIDSELAERARAATRTLCLAVLLIIGVVIVSGFITSEVMQNMLFTPWIVAVGILALLALLGAGLSIIRKNWLVALVLIGLAIALATLAFGLGLFPRVLISSLNPAWTLTAANTAAHPSSLILLTWVTLIVLPVTIFYQAWGHWLFRKKLTMQNKLYY